MAIISHGFCGISDGTKWQKEIGLVVYARKADRIESCKKLLEYDFKNVYPFHYEPIEKNGKEKLAAYLSER